MGNAGCEIWGHVQYASYRSSGSDHLDGSDPAWFQSGRDRLEERRQVLVPDRLEHLDRDHFVEGAVLLDHVAVVAVLETHQVRHPRRLQREKG